MPSPEGTLTWRPLAQALDLAGGPVRNAHALAPTARIAAIDPAVADTAAFCAAYDVDPAASANCVVVSGRRDGVVSHAAVLVLAVDRADVNGVIRRHLGVRKLSFAPQQEAVALTGMEHGGITPIGLPPGWPLLVDTAVAGAQLVVVGAGARAAKLLLPGAELAGLPGAQVLELTLPRQQPEA